MNFNQNPNKFFHSAEQTNPKMHVEEGKAWNSTLEEKRRKEKGEEKEDKKEKKNYPLLGIKTCINIIIKNVK